MLNNFTVKTRLFALIAFFATLSAIVGIIGITGINDSNENLRTVYFDRAIPLAQLSKIQDLMSDRVIQLSLISKQAPQNAIALEELKQETLAHIQTINALWSAYMSTYLTAEEQVLARDYTELRNSLIYDGILPAINTIKLEPPAHATAVISQTLLPKYQLALEKSNELINLQTRVAKENYDDANTNYKRQLILTLAFALLANIIGLLVGIFFVRKLARQLREEVSAVQQIATGDLSMDLPVDPDDKASLFFHLKKLQQVINEFATSQQLMNQLHAEGFINETLWADAFPGIFREIATQINDLVGSHIAVKMQVAEVIRQYANGDFSVDMVRLPGEQAKITEAIDNLKQSLLNLSSEIKTLCDAGIAGDFSKRSDTGGYRFIYQDILANFNQLMETCDIGFNDVLWVSQAIADGNLAETMQQEYPGTIGRVKIGLNSTVANLRSLLNTLQDSTQTLNTACKAITIDHQNLSQLTEAQSANLEKTAWHLQALTSVVQANIENAKQANHLAICAANIANQGIAIVAQVLVTMVATNEYARQISSIISVIDNIAHQTDSLPMTAAVNEIKGIIAGYETQIAQGRRLVDHAQKSMMDMAKAMHEVTTVIAQITNASTSQNAGITEINQAIAQLDENIRQSGALVGQVSATSASLNAQNQQLIITLGHFKTPEPETIEREAPRKSYALDFGTSILGKPRIKAVDGSDWEEF